MKFYFDIDTDSPNYEEEWFYGVKNMRRLKMIAEYFHNSGVPLITGDILVVVGIDEDGDHNRFEIVRRTFMLDKGNESVSYLLQYTDK